MSTNIVRSVVQVPLLVGLLTFLCSENAPRLWRRPKILGRFFLQFASLPEIDIELAVPATEDFRSEKAARPQATIPQATNELEGWVARSTLLFRYSNLSRGRMGVGLGETGPDLCTRQSAQTSGHREYNSAHGDKQETHPREEHISTFEVKAIHKPGREHYIPDALSRLKSTNNVTDPTAPGQLEDMPDDRPMAWGRHSRQDMRPDGRPQSLSRRQSLLEYLR